MDGEPESELVLFRSVEAGTGAGSTVPVGVVVVRTEADWQDYWRAVKGDGARVPVLDWATEMVVCYALGMRGTTGYEARIEHLVVRAGALEVHTVEVQPGPEINTGQMLTYPYHVVAAPACLGTPRHVERVMIDES